MLLEALQVIGIFVVPVLLLRFDIISFRYVKHMIAGMTAVVVLIVLIEKMTLAELGIRADNIAGGVVPYAVGTAAGAVFLLAISAALKRERQAGFLKKKFFLYEFLVISAFQEFIFRGFLFSQLREIFSSGALVIVINVLLFVFLHTLYSNDLASLLVIVFGGTYFAVMYHAYPNLLLVTVSHAVLNYIAVLYNFYRKEPSAYG